MLTLSAWLHSSTLQGSGERKSGRGWYTVQRIEWEGLVHSTKDYEWEGLVQRILSGRGWYREY